MLFTHRYRQLMIAASLLSVYGISSTLCSAVPLLELTVGDVVHVGKSVAHDDDVCWIECPDGRLSEIPLKQVTSYRKVNDRFEGIATVALRSRLREEFGRGWEIVGTGHYLVCAPSGRAARFGQEFENLYRSFRGYFARRGFELPKPEFPMVGVVYPTEKDFAIHCRSDGVPYMPGLKGYYHRLTNRTNLFESADSRLSSAAPIAPFRLSALNDSRSDFLRPSNQPRVLDLSRFWDANLADADSVATPWDPSISGSLKNTIVHEATHQVAYNLGLHSRIGDNPKWLTEGLATMFEAEGTRRNTGGKRPQERLNDERFARFTAFAQRTRDPGSLDEFIMSDRMFQTSVLNAYAQAWALTFFLAETRGSQFTEYLKLISARPPMETYTPEERLADFQEAFGNDIDRLEVSFLRFLSGL